VPPNDEFLTPPNQPPYPPDTSQADQANLLHAFGYIEAETSGDVEMTDSEIMVNVGESKRVSDFMRANPYLMKATPPGSTLHAPASYNRLPQHPRSILMQRGGSSPSGSDLGDAGTQLSTIHDTTQLRCLTRNDCK
jgi:hypothetical protein